jgi:hypothetical protein
MRNDATDWCIEEVQDAEKLWTAERRLRRTHTAADCQPLPWKPPDNTGDITKAREEQERQEDRV